MVFQVKSTRFFTVYTLDEFILLILLEGYNAV